VNSHPLSHLSPVFSLKIDDEGISLTSRYRMISQSVIEFNQMAMRRVELQRNEEIFNRVFTKDNIAYAIILEDMYCSEHILVVNVHIHWDPAYKDVKLIQTILLMEHLETIVKAYEEAKRSLSVIICGDFNSLPDSGVYEFMSKGVLRSDHPCFSNLPYQECFPSDPHHPLKLKDAYTPPYQLPFTNFTALFTGIIDYIWYTDHRLKLVGLLGPVDKEHVKHEVGFPNTFFPSDHIPLMASFHLLPQ
jgi:CCR4-NOT transcription complex subunit 6